MMNEKMLSAPVFAVKRFAVHDGDGIRTTLFLSGCPLRCLWCHNPEGLSAAKKLAFRTEKCRSCGICVAVCPTGAHTVADETHRFDREKCIACGLCESVCPADALTLYGREMTVWEAFGKLAEDRAFYGKTGGATLSGGECLSHPAFVLALTKKLYAEGIGTDIDTCGFAPYETFSALLPYVDTFLYDIKADDGEVHRRLTGQDNALIWDNLSRLCADGAKVEVRVPYVPGYNSSEMPAIADRLSRLPLSGVRILAYHDLSGSKYAALGLPSALPERLPTEDEMREVCALFARGNRVIV